MKKNIVKLSLLAVVAAGMFSCSDDPKARVLVVHGSPDAPGVDLLVDDVKVNTDALTFPNNTGYLEITAGTRNIKVNAAGTSTTVINADVNFAADANYTLFANDILANIEATLFTDDLTAPAAGKSHVRFIHMSPDAPAVDIALDGGAVVFGNVSYTNGTNFTPLDAGSYDLEVRLAGTQTVVLDIEPAITVEDGKIYTVFAKGLAGGTPASLGAEIIVNN